MRIALATAAFLAAGVAQATSLTPTLQVFGDVADVADPDPTFGGSGIPTSPFAYSKFTNGGDTLTLSLGVTQRFFNPVPGANPANSGVYTVQPGANTGGPGITSPFTAALWSYNVFAEITSSTVGGPTTTFSDYDLKFLFDTDAGADTDIANLNVFDFTAGGLGGQTRFELNSNLAFVDSAVIVPGLTYALAVFDPNARGEYDFALQSSLGDVAIEVNAVPLPAPVLMLLAAMGGLGVLGWRKRGAAA